MKVHPNIGGGSTDKHHLNGIKKAFKLKHLVVSHAGEI